MLSHFQMQESSAAAAAERELASDGGVGGVYSNSRGTNVVLMPRRKGGMAQDSTPEREAETFYPF